MINDTMSLNMCLFLFHRPVSPDVCWFHQIEKLWGNFYKCVVRLYTSQAHIHNLLRFVNVNTQLQGLLIQFHVWHFVDVQHKNVSELITHYFVWECNIFYTGYSLCFTFSFGFCYNFNCRMTILLVKLKWLEVMICHH